MCSGGAPEGTPEGEREDELVGESMRDKNEVKAASFGMIGGFEVEEENSRRNPSW